MKKQESKVGGHYVARISGRIVTVRVDAIRECDGFKRVETVFDVTNLVTGRKTTFRSAAKFRGMAKSGGTMMTVQKCVCPCSDPNCPNPGDCDAMSDPDEELGLSETVELSHPEATADKLLQEEQAAATTPDLPWGQDDPNYNRHH